MKILVINAGSSSIKYQLIDMDNKQLLAKGLVERIGIKGSKLTHKVNGNAYEFEQDIPTHAVGMEIVLEKLLDEKVGVVKNIDEINGFGHRVLQGGDEFNKPTLITAEVVEGLRRYIDYAPLHMPANIMGIEACLKVAPKIPNVAVFDTSFHTELPDYAKTYAIPYEFYEKYGIKRYGAHGVSHQFIANEAARFLNKDINNLKIITCHIGNGASIDAVLNGKAIDTSMGLTPLEGLVMGTRSGDIDPAIMEFIMRKENWDIKRMMECLNKESGLLGISGISNDVRDVNKQLDTNPRAKLAVDVFCYRIKKYIGAYAAALGGVDVIVFSAGTGENRDDIREKVMSNMEYLGVDFDFEANKNFTRGINCIISKPDSKVSVVIIPTDEEMEIARYTVEMIENK